MDKKIERRLWVSGVITGGLMIINFIWTSIIASSEPLSRLSPDGIAEVVQSRLAEYDANLKVDEIFVFGSSSPYISVIEKNTGRGAMELVFDPYTERIYPEQGPNLAWNLKYHMSGGWTDTWKDRDNKGSVRATSLNKPEAAERANMELYRRGAAEKVDPEGHHFYGYYTFHVVNDKDRIVGLVSINEATGQGWHHDWHGEVRQVFTYQ